jgi:ribosomal protein S27E
MIKCLVCRERTAIIDIQKAMTCTICTAFLTNNGGHQYIDGETIKQYIARLTEVLDMKVGA